MAIAFRYRVNTDEPQHLHVAWGWTQGLVPYRDLFDNHAPLFHLLTAPLVAALGERADLIILMRLAMIPLAALALAATAVIGRALYSPRVGWWAALLVGAMPAFLLTSSEFRADDLWAALWLGALAVALGGPPTPRRALATGILCGASLATSMKTLLLGANLVAGIALALAVDPERRERLRAVPWPAVVWCAAGIAVVVVAGLALFTALGAERELFACLFTQNRAAFAFWDHRWLRTALFLASLPLLAALGRAVLVHSACGGFTRAALLLATPLYAATLNAFWPLVSAQNYLPFYPLLAIFVVAGLFEALERSAVRSTERVLLAIAVAEIGLTLWVAPITSDGTRFEVGRVREVLLLTRPGDPVMDLKGESIFRPRPIFHALEAITLERIRRGEIRDEIAERLVATRTYVSFPDSNRYPPQARRFLLDNYLPVGFVRVAGKLLAPDARGISRLAIAIPGRYVVLSPSGPAAGLLDGTPLREPRALEAGSHTFEAKPAATPLAIVWADAAERGFSPFHDPP